MPSSNYSITIAAIGGTAPSDGFVDPFRVEQYLTKTGDQPATYAASLTKERANMRWVSVENKLQTLGNIYLRDRDAPGGSPSAAPTSVSFKALVEHGHESLRTYDENEPGAIITGEAAIRRVIARALHLAYDRLGEVIDPVRPRMGYARETLSVGGLGSSIADVESKITVTRLS